MKITNLRLKGLSAFADSGPIQFGGGMNLIIGQNNVGKSALLSSIRPEYNGTRHTNKSQYEGHLLPATERYIEMEFSGPELVNALLKSRFELHFPTASEGEEDQRLSHKFLAAASVRLTACYQEGMPVRIITDPTHEHYRGGRSHFAAWGAQNGSYQYLGARVGGADTLANAIAALHSQSVFYFQAQRQSVGRFNYGRQEQLLPDASNLAAVLSTLRGDRNDLFDKLVEHIREIFPTIKNLSVANLDQFVIKIWPTREQIIEQLSYTLDQSGTGVSQAVSILCAAITLKPSVILIDEISSFLHPAATKSLLRILTTYYSHHQYIVTTHSAEVISYAGARSIHLVRRHDTESRAVKIELKDASELREVAGELGISLTDVFGAERLLWVEGATEEICFPLIYESVNGLPVPAGTTIAAVVATGDFGRGLRNYALVSEIYDRLSRAAHPLSGDTLFCFDREDLSPENVTKLEAEHPKLRFIERRNIESYFVFPAAINQVLIDELAEWNSPTHAALEITEDKVVETIALFAASPPQQRL